MQPNDYIVTVTTDKPLTGMWHCGPNPSWVTVTHKRTLTQARAYHRSQHKAREIALACVELMLQESHETDCSNPEALLSLA